MSIRKFIKRVASRWVMGLIPLGIAGYHIFVHNSTESPVVGFLIGLAIGQVGMFVHIYLQYRKRRVDLASASMFIGLVVIGLIIMAWSKYMAGGYIFGYLTTTIQSWSTIDAFQASHKSS